MEIFILNSSNETGAGYMFDDGIKSHINLPALKGYRAQSHRRLLTFSPFCSPLHFLWWLEFEHFPTQSTATTWLKASIVSHLHYCSSPLLGASLRTAARAPVNHYVIPFPVHCPLMISSLLGVKSMDAPVAPGLVVSYLSNAVSFHPSFHSLWLRKWASSLFLPQDLVLGVPSWWNSFLILQPHIPST